MSSIVHEGVEALRKETYERPVCKSGIVEDGTS